MWRGIADSITPERRDTEKIEVYSTMHEPEQPSR